MINMKKIKFISIVACLFTVLLFANYAFATEYTLTLLGDLEGGTYFSNAYGINNLGQVAGVGSILGNDNKKYQVPTFWDSGNGMTQLSQMGEAYRINDNGQVVGNTWSTPNQLPIDAFIWDAINGISTLGNLGGTGVSMARDINNSGQAVGYSLTPQGGEAFIWDSQNGMVSIGRFEGGLGSDAYAINELGQVVGQSNNSSDFNEAFIWDSQNGMVGLGSLLGGNSFYSIAYDINDSGQVIGESIGQYGYEPFIWDSQGGIVGLGSLNASHGSARGMNNLGQVVGESSGSPFIWDSVNGMVNLNTLVDTGTFQLSVAYDINDNGQIVGLGYGPDGGEAFLLTPTVVPEPISSILFITGGTLLVGKRYMKKRKQNITKTCS